VCPLLLVTVKVICGGDQGMKHTAFSTPGLYIDIVALISVIARM
jgi:hypothetical protein